jgi:hypothetical protein
VDLAIVTEEEADDMSRLLVDGFRAQLSKAGDLSLAEKYLTESEDELKKKDKDDPRLEVFVAGLIALL